MQNQNAVSFDVKRLEATLHTLKLLETLAAYFYTFSLQWSGICNISICADSLYDWEQAMNSSDLDENWENC